MDPLPAVAAPRRGRAPPPPQQYPYNPTPNVVTNQYGIEQWFRNAFITKVIVLFTIIYYFLQQQQQQYSTGRYHSSESHIAVWDTLLRPHSNRLFQYVLSKMIFMRSHHAMNSSSSYDSSSSNDASSTTIVLLWMNVWYQWYLYRWLERQMSSYQLVRFLLFVVFSTILLEYTIMSYSLNMDAVTMRPWIVPSSSSSSSLSSYTIYGPYSTIGAVSLYYHWYRPRLYPRFVTIASICHLSEKSLFYFYSIYFIIIHYNSSTSSSSNNSYNNDHGAIHVITSMCMGMGLAMVYVTLSNHPKICYYDQWIHDRIRRQSIFQRYFHTHPPTPRTGTTARVRNPTNMVQHRGGTTTVPQPPSSSSQLRQRTTTAANMAATGSDPNQHRNNPWTIPGGGGGGVNHNNNIDNMDETDPNGLDRTGGMEEDTMMTTTIPLLPHDQVDPDAVEQLCRMGFERAPVVLALRQSQNNIEHAAHRLLSSTTG